MTSDAGISAHSRLGGLDVHELACALFPAWQPWTRPGPTVEINESSTVATTPGRT